MGVEGEEAQGFLAKDSGLCTLVYGQQWKALEEEKEEENSTVISSCCKKAICANTGVHNSVRLRRGTMKPSATQRHNFGLQRWDPSSRSACLDAMFIPWESPTF